MATISNSTAEKRQIALIRGTRHFGRTLLDACLYAGGISILLGKMIRFSMVSLFGRTGRFARSRLVTQMVRVGVRSIPIVLLIQFAVGFILALQMAPPLRDFGLIERVATIVAITAFRELGPLMAAIVLAGFAGASIAAELGTMVTTEEIEALQVHAINPVRFLVVPRVLATMFMLLCLTVLADLVMVLGGFVTAVYQLDLSPHRYYHLTIEALTNKGFLTGLIKGATFGLLISLIACYQGLSVKPSQGSEGVGQATTITVVHSIVAIILTDAVLTAIFYAYDFFD